MEPPTHSIFVVNTTTFCGFTDYITERAGARGIGVGAHTHTVTPVCTNSCAQTYTL